MDILKYIADDYNLSVHIIFKDYNDLLYDMTYSNLKINENTKINEEPLFNYLNNNIKS